MGADPIGALPAGQGNAERARAMNRSFRSSDEGLDWPPVFIPPLRAAVVELEWASRVPVRSRNTSIPHGGVGKSGHASLVGLADCARGIRWQCHRIRDLGLAQGCRACANRNK